MDTAGSGQSVKAEGAVPEKILIVKLSAIGDVVQTLPMLNALRRKFPEAQIDWVVEEEAAGLIKGYPGLDRVLVNRRKTWQKDFRKRGKRLATLGEIRRFVKELREVEYDWVIDTHGVLKSGVLVGLSRGKRKIGYRATAGIASEGSYLFTRERYAPLSIERHALERYLDLVGQLGVPIAGAAQEFSLPAGSQERVREILGAGGFDVCPLAVIHPLAKWETKQWPPERFADLADRLAGRGMPIVFTGSHGDTAVVEGILGRMRHRERALNLSGKTNLGELAALFSRADLVISPDTGPMHLAAAVEAPLVALFGPTAPWRTGPYGKGPAVLRHELPCSPCFRKKCAKRECMERITVEEVLQAAEAKLRERRGSWL